MGTRGGALDFPNKGNEKRAKGALPGKQKGEVSEIEEPCPGKLPIMAAQRSTELPRKQGDPEGASRNVGKKSFSSQEMTKEEDINPIKETA